MSSALRNVIHKKLTQSLHDTSSSTLTDILANLRVKRDSTNFSFFLPLKTKNYDIRNEAENISKNVEDIPEINIKLENDYLVDFQFTRDIVVKKILENNVINVSPPRILPDDRRVVIDFSSPNIAKPFHVGHLRSTIIGNYLANLHNFLNDRVTKINYLGDWGTQFGYIKLGIDMLCITEEKMKLNPMKELYEAYVAANKSAENDPTMAERARKIFESLEKGDEEILEEWKNLKGHTIEELSKTYGRLGINFDEYQWESNYSSNKINSIIERMERLKLLSIDAEKRKIVNLDENRNIPVIKSDGSTLYLTRDIAAAIDRYDNYNFDLMYYVVENSQTDHFKNLMTILRKMDTQFSHKIRHVKFGKIQGMSTRRGTAIFLHDFLNEARDSMREKQKNSLTTKVSLDPDDDSSDILGISAIIIHDLKRKRHRNYEFNWNVALDIKGETGVKLQYSHCRLINLEENCGATLPNECDPTILREPIVNDLVWKIIQFDEAIISSYQTLEPCHLVKYLFDLSHIVNKTLKELRVKDEPSDVGSQRLLLYRVSRNVLAKGMTLLGLRPLEKM